MKKQISAIVCCIITIFSLSIAQAACLAHKYAAATCTKPATCTVCGATKGTALGHSYSAPTCTKPATCSRCGNTSGSAAGHSYSAATCTKPKTCSKCGATSGSALGHSYKVTSTTAATCTTAGKTVKTCSRCGDVVTTTISATGHSYRAATCTKAKTCTVCGATSGSALGHNYVVSSTTPATCTTAGQTVSKCSRCGDTKTTTIPVTAHTYSAATCTKPKTCTKCGATEGTALGHTFGYSIIDETWHSRVCSRCQFSSGPEAHVFDGNKCKLCGYTKQTHTHDFSYKPATCTTAATCSCGVTSGSALGHAYILTSTVDASCTTVGKKIYTCSRCGATKTEEIPATGHSYTTKYEQIAKNDTQHYVYQLCSKCNAQTAKTLDNHTFSGNTCTKCGYTKSSGTTPHTHSYTTVVSTVAATCTTDGSQVLKCSCGATTTKVLTKLGHDYKTTTVDATCTTKGSVTKKCSRCGDTKVSETPALGHDYKVKYEQIANNDAQHNLYKECSRCGDKTAKTLDNHVFDGNKCKLCGYTKSSDAHTHSYTIVVSTVAATCTTDGSQVLKCSCGATTTKVLTKLGHDYKTTTTDATCTKAGKTVKVCSRCGDTQTTEIPALGHKEVIKKNETNHWSVCSRCGEQIMAPEAHTFVNNKCKVCGYVKSETPDDDELIVEPWMKENNDLSTVAVSLRSIAYDSEDKVNNNIYALNEKVIYFVDYANGGKDITDTVKLTLELPLDCTVNEKDGGTVSGKTITWTMNGLEKDASGTKEVVVTYTSLGSKSLTSKIVTPDAKIYVKNKVKDTSSVINLIVKAYGTESEETHYPYMYGDANVGTFRPDSTITRAEGALVLTRIFGISYKDAYDSYTFPDLDQTYPEAQKAIKAAKAYGLVNGYADGTFRPNSTMTRAEFMTILARELENLYGDGFEVKDEDELIKVYKARATSIDYDSSEADEHWAYEYITLLCRLNMTSVSSDNKNLRVDERISRAEVAQLCNYFLLRTPVEVEKSTKVSFPDVSKKHELYADIVEATREAHEATFNENGEEVID